MTMYVMAAATAAALLYILAGYPLLLALRARLLGKPVKRSEQYRARVTVIIAVRNGARWLSGKLDSVLAQDYPRDLVDIMVVSDGSTDATEAIATRYADRGVRLMVVPQGGKPAALNAAVPQARAELLLLTDVRQVLDPGCLGKLVAAMADPEVGVASGDLRISSGVAEEERHTGLYWRYENWIRSNLARVDSMLGATGPIYLIRRSLYTPIPPDSLLDDVFLPLSAHLKGYRLVLEEGAIATDEPSDLSIEFRRKVRTQAGIVQLLRTFPGLFSSRNRMRFDFVSLKIGRLLLPYLCAVLLISSLALPAPWRWWIAGPQAAFWALAALYPVFPSGSAAKKLSAVPRAVALLILAAVFALKVLFVSPQKLWIEARPHTPATS
jgi:cellulose synthase/poly-beta-1,6-N-acetylglucosamine synthase-like glycosyltransferase